ncbi:MAG: hypothetical protein V5B33_02070 [Candidatus Accumulibacter sp. UW20]
MAMSPILLADKLALFRDNKLQVTRIVAPDDAQGLGISGEAKRLTRLLFERNIGVHAQGIIGAKNHSFFGAHSYINAGGYFRAWVFVGRYCSIGRRVTIGAGSHSMDGLSTSTILRGSGALYLNPCAFVIKNMQPVDCVLNLASPLFTKIEHAPFFPEGIAPPADLLRWPVVDRPMLRSGAG